MASCKHHGYRLAAALLAVACVPLLSGADDGFDSRILSSHNVERARRGIAPLQWNAGLAYSAGVWAQHLAASGTFRHAPENNAAPEGENLWAGTPDLYSPEAMVDAWVREQRFFRPGPFPANSTTGRIADVGHYTQLMWRATHSIGCALAHGEREDVLVCRYSAAGNYEGEMPF